MPRLPVNVEFSDRCQWCGARLEITETCVRVFGPFPAIGPLWLHPECYEARAALAAIGNTGGGKAANPRKD